MENYKYNNIKWKNLSILTLYIYIVSIFIFSYSENLNFISKISFIIFVIISGIYISKRKFIHIHTIYFFWILWSIWILFSTLWSIELNASFSKFITIIQIGIFSIIMYELFITEDSVEHILNAILIGGIAMCIYIVLDYGIANILDAMIKGSRLDGKFTNINTIGVNASITFLLVLYKIINYNKKVYIGIIPIVLMIVFATASRKALLVSIIGTILLIIFKYGLKKIYKTIIMSAIVIFIINILTNIPMFSTVSNRMEGINNLINHSGTVDASTQIRYDMILKGIDMIYKKPIVGYGIDTYRYNEYGVYSHNNYIEVMYGTGIIGLAIYYFAYIYVIIKLIPNIIKKDYIAIIIFIIIINNLIMDVAMVSYYDKLTYIYLTLGFIYSRNRKKVVQKN